MVRVPGNTVPVAVRRELRKLAVREHKRHVLVPVDGSNGCVEEEIRAQKVVLHGVVVVIEACAKRQVSVSRLRYAGCWHKHINAQLNRFE